MAGGITGGDFAQVEAMRLSEDRARQAALFGALSDYARRTQQQRQFETDRSDRNRNALSSLAQQAEELAQRKTEREATMGLQERQLKMNETYQDWAMKQPSRTDASDIKAARNLRANFKIEEAGKGNFDPNDPFWKDENPDVVSTAADLATQAREKLKPKYDRVLAALALHNQARRMEEVASGIESDQVAKGGGRWNPLNWFGKSSPDPKLIAQDLKTKAAKLKADSAPLLKEASDFKDAGLTQDPKTKKFIAQFPDWYKELAGRQLRMASPTAGTATNAAPEMAAPPVDPRALNMSPAGITNAPPPMTGTNRPAMPPVVRQNGVLFRLMPNGQYEPVPAR